MESDDTEWPPWVQQWVMPFLEESGLWPVLAALIGHVMVIVAPLMLSLYRGFVPAMLPLFFMAAFSIYCCVLDIRRRMRPGAVTVTVVIVWVLSVALAGVAHTTGVF